MLHCDQSFDTTLPLSLCPRRSVKALLGSMEDDSMYQLALKTHSCYCVFFYSSSQCLKRKFNIRHREFFFFFCILFEFPRYLFGFSLFGCTLARGTSLNRSSVTMDRFSLKVSSLKVASRVIALLKGMVAGARECSMPCFVAGKVST